MKKLWEPNENYDEFKPPLWGNMPYKRLYNELTSIELEELIQDAMQMHWRTLDLRHTQIHVLPDSIGQLSELRALNLYKTHIKRLPDCIKQLVGLQTLDLHSTQITEVPESIGLLKSLESLYLHKTKIQKLPSSIGRLSSLRVLYLSFTQVNELPSSIGRLSSLQELYLRRTQITELPDSIGRLSNLQRLDLSYTEISELPSNIGLLSELQMLDLRSTPIKQLPDSIGKLKNLQALYLSFTQICELPDSIALLTNLQTLDLNGTPIQKLSNGIGNLSNLQTLDLSETQIRKLPDSIEHLSNLQSLYLRRSKISELPNSIGKLKQLKTLYLSFCHLSDIPFSIIQMGLPFSTTELCVRNCITLDGVTLDKGDITLFSQPREVIEAYYRNKEDAQIIRECKVIFLGDGGGGKSSLIQRMINGTFLAGSLPTDGVKMTKWTVPVNGDNFILRILDFGGQEIMHSMHRCFLTAHTVYVVVCASRDDTDIDAAAARWLETIKSFAPDCPVILALNKADLNTNVSVNERNLRERNPALRYVLKTSAAVEPDEEYGISVLVRAIQKQIPDAVHEYKANPNILALKAALENMEADTISADDYRKLCVENHIMDEKLQYSLLGFFRDLGVAYFYESKAFDVRLKSVRVLNPAWLTNGIYRLILRTKETGFLPHETIEETLAVEYPGDISKITYTPEETEYILHVMRFFQISHDMGNDMELIPMKLPKTPPKVKSGDSEEFADMFPKADALHLRWEGQYLPNNLIHRLMIRKFPELDTCRLWRTGGQFHQRSGDCAALAVMDDNTLDVYVTGARDCRPYLDTFRAEIQDILGGLNLKPQEIVFVTVDGQTGHVPYEDVVQEYYDGIEKVLIPGTRKYFNPAELLRDTYYHWEQEATHYQNRMERSEINLNVTVQDRASKNVATGKPDNPLDEVKCREEIELTRAEKERNKAEARQININVSLKVALALLIPALIVLSWIAGRFDLLERIMEWLFSLPGS